MCRVGDCWGHSVGRLLGTQCCDVQSWRLLGTQCQRVSSVQSWRLLGTQCRKIVGDTVL